MSGDDAGGPRGLWLGAAIGLTCFAMSAAMWPGCFDFGTAAEDSGAVGMDAAEPRDATATDAVAEDSPPDAPEVDAPLPEAIVRIRSLAFVPPRLTVPAGTTVRWIMEDPGVFHFVLQGLPRMTDPPAQFGSPQLDPGDEWTYTFNDVGEFIYHCSNHSSIMRDAMIIVE